MVENGRLIPHASYCRLTEDCRMTLHRDVACRSGAWAEAGVLPDWRVIVHCDKRGRHGTGEAIWRPRIECPCMRVHVSVSVTKIDGTSVQKVWRKKGH